MWETAVAVIGSILGRLFAPVLWRWIVGQFGRPPVWTQVYINSHYAPMFGVLATSASHDERKVVNRDELTYFSGMPIVMSIRNTGAGSEARTVRIKEITMTVEDYVPLTEHVAEQGTFVALQTVQAGGRGSECAFAVRLSTTERTSLPLLSYARQDNGGSLSLLNLLPDGLLEVALDVTARHPGRYVVRFDLAIQWGSRQASVRVKERMWILETPNVAWAKHAVAVYEPTGEVRDLSVQAVHEMWDEWRRLQGPLVLPDIEGRKARVRGGCDQL